jgi:hypothetical protein
MALDEFLCVPEARNVEAQDEVLGRQMHESSAGGTAS